jgi:hypothetical protein
MLGPVKGPSSHPCHVVVLGNEQMENTSPERGVRSCTLHADHGSFNPGSGRRVVLL